jgi:lysophospholipase L1-like esterase
MSSPAYPKILMLGDSLTQTSFEGWGAGLANTYQRRADILNRGLSGYNSRWYLQYAQGHGVWNEQGVVLVTIFFGANDASLAVENPHAHVPLDEYTDNLKTLIQQCQKHYQHAKILMIGPPPVYHEQRIAFQKQRYGDKATGVLERTLKNTGLYAEACKKTAKQFDLPIVDLYTSMQEATKDWGKFFTDGLHFSKDGHEFVELQIQKTIDTKLPSLFVTPDPVTRQNNNSGSSCPSIKSSGPYHDHIDHLSWEKAFGKESSTRAKTAEPSGSKNDRNDD